MNSITEVLDFGNFRNLGVSGKFFSSLGKIGVCPEKWGGGGRRKKILSRGPKVAEKGPRHKICLRAPCSSVTLLLISFYTALQISLQQAPKSGAHVTIFVGQFMV